MLAKINQYLRHAERYRNHDPVADFFHNTDRAFRAVDCAGLLAFEPAVEKINDIQCGKQGKDLPVRTKNTGHNGDHYRTEQIGLVGED